MPKSLFAISFLLLSVTTFGQFSITPTDSLYGNVVADSTISIFQIDLINETADSLNLTWKLIEENVTEGWDYNLCDLGECYTGVPNSAEMQAFASGEAGYLKMLVNPLSIEGYGFWHFWVYPSNDQDNFVNLYFSINASGTEGIIESMKEMKIFPNPAKDQIFISTNDLQSVQLFGLNGSLITELKSQSKVFDISAIPSGIYFLVLQNSKGRATQKLVIE
tara:strand:- start:508 stop:1167 length:660 start_codon:yes stop_codon:yes gene_type:complete